MVHTLGATLSGQDNEWIGQIVLDLGFGGGWHTRQKLWGRKESWWDLESDLHCERIPRAGAKCEPKPQGRNNLDQQGCHSERVESKQKHWFSLCFSIPLSKYWMKNMGKERDLQEGLHICKFATLQKKKKKCGCQSSLRGRAGGLQPIRGTGLGKPELLAQQEHRYGSSPENQVGKWG